MPPSSDPPREYTPYQLEVIRRYYENLPNNLLRRLEELVGDLYLTTGKKGERLWERTRQILVQLEIPSSRIDYILSRRDPVLVAEIVQELLRQKKPVQPERRSVEREPKSGS
ncbi:MAG: hypothetical protein NZM42_06540 [Gemmatales bacterium]|nr:hypothetical protein [Gemmatales bacterium]MDW8223047.1 hypothetical protein [Gemmatales bacterium]